MVGHRSNNSDWNQFVGYLWKSCVGPEEHQRQFVAMEDGWKDNFVSNQDLGLWNVVVSFFIKLNFLNERIESNYF